MANDTHGGKDNSNHTNRTSRTKAIEHNDAKNFEEGPPYDITGGHPITKDMPSQKYKGVAADQRTPVDTSPIEHIVPFTIKGA